MEMKVTREVVLDLLPLYLSGEASPATRALVERYLETDPELAARARLPLADSLARPPAPPPPPELALRSLRRTRRRLALQRWLFGFAISFTAVGLSLRIRSEPGAPPAVRLEIFEHPRGLGVCLAIAALLWIAYWAIGRRVRLGQP